MDSAAFLSSVGVTPDHRAPWRPSLFHVATTTDVERLRALGERGEIAFVHDTIEAQLRDLMAVRHPDRKLERRELDGLAVEHLGGTPIWAHGPWCFYPWSRRLVHVLPETEFRELRTSANRNRITQLEQRRLRELRIGVVGLSVGHSTALTLAQEEIGGEYRLADFDTLDPSNLNRLRVGVHEIGSKKAVLTARAIFEIDPFARIELFEEGVTEENVDAFLARGAPLDLVFEECDSLHIKILVREKARALRIPVLMETSDRGMLDVERFDREPDRPLLHGLIGDLRAEDVRSLTNYEKMPTILRILGVHTASRRLVASMVDIETTLKTWPQLASAVTLGGALNADAARRIALGSFHRSGRFYVDLEQLVSDSAGGDAPALDDLGAPASQPRPETPAPPPLPAAPTSTEESARIIAAYASLAPSGGNCQPWRFHLSGDSLFLEFDRARSGTLLDFRDQASYLALGAALENAICAARAMGIDPDLTLFPDASFPDRVAALNLATRRAPSDDAAAMVAAMSRRVTNRRLGARVPLRPDVKDHLRERAASHGARLDWVDGEAELLELADILAEGDRFRFYNARLYREMMGELRWTAEEASRSRDGIDVATLELTPADWTGMRVVASRSVIDEIVHVGGGQGLGKSTRKAVAAAAALGRIAVDGSEPISHLIGGRAVQRAWVEANRLGFAFQPLTALVYLFARLEQGGEEPLLPEERRWLRELRRRYLAVLPTAAGQTEMMLFRIAVAGPPNARSLRRSVDEILTIEKPAPRPADGEPGGGDGRGEPRP